MNISFVLLVVVWIALLAAIPSGVYTIYQSVKERDCCSSLILGMIIVQMFFVVAFVAFTPILFPQVHKFF